MRTALDNLRWTTGWTLRFAAAALIAETATLAIDGALLDATIVETAAAIAIAAFLAGLSGLLAGLAVGVLLALAAGRDRLDELAEQRWLSLRARLTTSDPTARRAFLALTIAAILTVLAGAAAAILPARELAAAVQTPLYVAILSVAATLLALIVSSLMWPLWIRIGRLATGPFDAPAPARALLGSALVFAAAALLLVWITWDALASYVPWRAPLTVLASLAISAAWVALRRSRPVGRLTRRLLVAIGALLVLGGAITAAGLPDSLPRTGYLIDDASGPLAPVRALLGRAFDFDRDGHLSWLGGRDCDARDPSVHPGAWDRPDDGVDQDCDGQDSTLVDLVKPGRHDYAASPHPRPMPVILVTIDAVSALRMELHGAERETMPNLTRRAADGAVFDWAFSEGPATRLSFPSLLSGLHASQIERRPSRKTTVPWTNVEHTIASVFAGSGYRTVAVSPDRYFAGAVRWLYKGFSTIDDSQARAGAGHVKNAADVTRTALERLDELASERKFLLWVHYTDAHYPHQLPPGADPVFGQSEADVYDRELLFLDEHLEPFLAGVEQRLAGRDYVLALTADHGQAFDSKHAKWHQDHDVSTAVTWVPLIFWSPWSEGRRIGRLANIIDVMPTLMNMVGIEAEGIAGDSLLPAIQGLPDDGRPIMQQFFLPEYAVQGKDPLVRVAVRQGRHVLHQIRKHGREQLFDFKADPLETDDLLDKRPDVARELRGIRDGTLAWAFPDAPSAAPAAGE